jgi:hypothetical protein
MYTDENVKAPLFCSTGFWIQGLTLASQVLYHLGHISSLKHYFLNIW